ncbi:MBOAT family O-acyltransferase [Marinicrinis sediminis]|uniref:MBOAT family O-acyltransferase n=1 Tax=Marinicrinis sediminis TaxID=1652465 RepID=A0ABW5RBF4_9BACL
MVFHSPNFIVFFAVLLLLYYAFRSIRLPLLVIGNLLFYAASGLGMLVVFVSMTILTFVCVHGMKRWKGWFWVGIVLNVGNLVLFKYTLLLFDTWEQLTGVSVWVYDAWATSVVLPVGISFYTFQFLSYLIDVRRGQLIPTRSLIRFWIYISFFPQLIAGPIMRGDELVPQLEGLKDKRIRFADMKYGMGLFMVGLLKKIALADPLASYVNPLFAKETMTAVEAWLAAYGFGFQIYFDFSAYSDMALGLAWMMGIRLILNFDSPYISANPSEFWRRWHISLSRWIRDYIYIGLGGNRKGPVRVQLNLLAAMLISGLWHGAMWTFVLWGGLHGVLLIVHRWSLKLNRWHGVQKMRLNGVYRIAAVFVFFHIIMWTWVFFRAESFGQAMEMTRLMLQVNPVALVQHPFMIGVAALSVLHVVEYGVRHHEKLASKWWHFAPFPIRSAVYTALLLLLFYLQRGETYEFIYFQF